MELDYSGPGGGGRFKTFNMRTEKIAGHTVKLYDSIEELPISRYHAFNKYLMYDLGIGADFQSVDTHIVRLARFIESDKRKAIKELENLRSNLYFIIEGINPEHMAFAALISEVDGKRRDDLSEEGVKDTLRLFKDEPKGLYKLLIEAVKKKISEELKTFFPDQFSDVYEKDNLSRTVRRTRIVLQGIIEGTDRRDDLQKIDDYILSANPPQEFSTDKGADVAFDRGYADMCLLISQKFHEPAEQMTTLKFYRALAIMKSEARAARRAAKKR